MTTPARRTPQERDALVLQWRWLPRHLLKRFSSRPAFRRVGADELEAVGLLKLVEAAGLWDETRGIQFQTYAGRAIRNEYAEVLFDSAVIRVPQYLGRRVHAAHKFRADAHRARGVRSLGPGLDRAVAAGGEADADHLAPALEALPPRRREALRLYFEEGLPQREVGARLGVAKQEAGRLIREGLKELRDLLGLQPLRPGALSLAGARPRC